MAAGSYDDCSKSGGCERQRHLTANRHLELAVGDRQRFLRPLEVRGERHTGANLILRKTVLGDLNARATFRYALENQLYDYRRGEGTTLAVVGVAADAQVSGLGRAPGARDALHR